jgi:hypothetical protein
MIDFILTNWLALIAAYGIIYIVYVFYALFELRFKYNRRVREDQFYEILGEALVGPVILPCKVIGNIFSAAKVAILGLVNAGLPTEEKKA